MSRSKIPHRQVADVRTDLKRLASLIVLIGAGSGAAMAQAPEAGGTLAVLPRDLTPWGMFLNADPLVKVVLLGLVFASVVTWTVWLAKTIELALARRQARAALHKLASARHLAEGVERIAAGAGPVGEFLEAAVA